MNRKQQVIVLAAALACGQVANAALEDRVGFKVESDRPAAHYRCGEEAVLKVTATNGCGEAVREGSVNWKFDNFTAAGTVAAGVWNFAEGNPRIFRGTLAKPDFLRLLITGDRVRDLSRWTPKQFWWGVAFEPEKIRPGGPNPTDFDAFWSNAVAKLEREVPLDPRVTRVAERSTKEYDFYRISFATVGGKRVHGFMSVPTDKAKAPFPVIFEVSSAGEGRWTMDMSSGLPDRIRVYFTVHNFEPPKTVGELQEIHRRMGSEMRAKYGTGYQSYGMAWSREDYYFYDKILGISRAANWVWSRDDVDRRRFGYIGGSQGGGFGLYLAGLNRHFTSVVLHVPALCDTLGYQGGHASGWPHLIEETPADKKAAAARNAPYFDGANFARRVTCPIRMSVGFVDTACNPASVYAAFNVCPAKDKKISDGVGLGHFGQTAVIDRVNNLWQKNLDGGAADSSTGFVWIEAEDFVEKGDWRVDTQFTHAMGSAYLICPGLDSPKPRPAVTSVDVPGDGDWTVWARTKDWLPEFSPGKFALEVNGMRGVTLGASKRGWSWERVGRFGLRAGKNEFRLVDLSGAFARCDAFVLARDDGYVPPDDAEALAKERMRLSGVDDTVAEGGVFDVIVVGAGPGGIGASVAAARHGARTLLLHDRPVIGGNCSSECGIGLGGAFAARDGVRECGLAEEARLIRVHLADSRPNRWASWTEAFRKLTDPLASTLTVVGDKRVVKVEKRGEGISAVIARDTRTGRLTRYQAAYFADATGDGWVGRFAGAESMYGREAGKEYGEEWIAPERRDELTMSGTIMGGCMGYGIRRLKDGVAPPYVTPVWANVLPKGFRRKVSGPQAPWWLENPGRIDDLGTPEEARDNLIRVSFAYFGWVRNEWEGRETAKSVVLDCVPFHYARREGWRLKGDHVLTANDCLAGTVFPDAVSGGGWSLDTHDPLGMENPGGDGWWHTHKGVPAYTLPFRSLYSTNVPNLFLSSRCISMTHIALGSVRVGGTIMALGQAVGTAAALCAKRRLQPRAYGQSYVVELQRALLRDDQSIPGLRDADLSNLAFAAKASDPALNDGWSYPSYDRRQYGRMNAYRGWKSEPSLPQAATLEWKHPVELGEIQVVFDSELKYENVREMPKSLAKAYELEVRTASGWERLADVAENFLRVGRHRFPAKKVDALRVTVRATWGDACARIFELRAYGPVVAEPVMREGRKLVWRDEFDGTKLDLNKWRFRRSMNGKDCKYVNDERTVRVQNGLLRLHVLPTGETNRPFMLPEGLTTHETMSFRYGYLEMRARVPFRHGAWPSFWLQSVSRWRSVPWMAEVDVFEAFSSSNQIASALHKWGRGVHTSMPTRRRGVGPAHYTFSNADCLNEEFHVYGFEWTPDQMRFYVDGQCHYAVTIGSESDYATEKIRGMEGFRDPLAVLINNEIFTPGHGWCPKGYELKPGEQLPIDYEIDWIRLYQKDGEEIRVLGEQSVKGGTKEIS